MTKQKKVLTNPAGTLKVVFDPSEWHANNPGDGTPEMVYMFRKNKEVGSATLACAMDTGEVTAYEGSFDADSLSLMPGEMKWLESIHKEGEYIYD